MYEPILLALVCAVKTFPHNGGYMYRPPKDLCNLPISPEHGNYTVVKQAIDDPCIDFEAIRLNFNCDDDYNIVGTSSIYCWNGTWSDETPKCGRSCNLDRQIGVEYLCKDKGSKEGSMFCDDRVVAGAEVEPKCVGPYFHSRTPLPLMTCEDGSWDGSPKCEPVCGLILPIKSRTLRQKTATESDGRKRRKHHGHGSGGRRWGHGTTPPPDVGRTPTDTDLPWHVGIYSKLETPYKQICGGSIVAYNLVVSAAHCFWSNMNGLQPASSFAVGAGKVYRLWDDQRDNKAQKTDVAEIIVPPRYWGAHTNFQDDIALVFLSTPLVYNRFVWPVCLDFDEKLDKSQLSVGRVGTVTGWGLTEENGAPSPVLEILDLPYIDTYQCIAEAQISYREYITSDKICAGHTNGTALCKGDSGGGLAFSELSPGDEGARYYLRGIASTAPTNENLCNTFTVTSFTKVSKHERFIKNQYSKVIWYPAT